jgi:serine protease inhibitor
MYSNFSNNKKHTSNSAIYDRSTETLNKTQNYKDIVAKKLFERETVFNTDTKKNSSRDYKEEQQEPSLGSAASTEEERHIGEITGQKFKVKEMDQGMPMRTQSLMASSNNNMYNPRLDFDLFDSKPKLEVAYHDPDVFASADIQNNTTTNTRNMMFDDFTFKIFNKLAAGSSVVSPLSVLILLIVLYSGSNTHTQKELQQVLNLSDKQNSLRSIRKLVNRFNTTKSCQVDSYMITRTTLSVNKAFADNISDLVTFDTVNVNKPEVEAARLSKLLNFGITPTMINDNTAIMLFNRIKFNAKWKVPFNKKDSTHKMFFSNNGAKKVLFMVQNNKTHNYYKDASFQLLEMKYADNIFAFGIVLPKNKNGAPTLSLDQLDYYVSNMQEQEITEINIPRFSHTSRYDGKEMLQKIGIRKLFVNMDISDIVPFNNALMVTQIIHQATIVVDESGTEATAETLMVMSDACDDSPEEIKFIANHPFVYYIRDIPSNTVLFVGRYQ